MCVEREQEPERARDSEREIRQICYTLSGYLESVNTLARYPAVLFAGWPNQQKKEQASEGSQFDKNHFTEMCSGSEAGAYLRLS